MRSDGGLFAATPNAGAGSVLAGRFLSSTTIYYTRFTTKLKIVKEMAILDLPSQPRGRLVGLRNALFHARFAAEYDPSKIQRAIKSIRVALAQLGESRQGAVAADIEEAG